MDRLEDIIRYIDGEMTVEERERFEREMSSDKKLQTLVRHQQAAERLMTEEKLVDPSRNFTQNVLQRLNEVPRSRQTFLNSLLLLAGIIVVVLIGSQLLTSGILDNKATTIDLNSIRPLGDYIPQQLPSLGVDMKQIIYIVIFLNVALALIVFDRTILRPYFQNRFRKLAE